MAKVRIPFSTSLLDYPDNSSICTSIYFMGCAHNCEGCHAPDFQDHTYSEYTLDVYSGKDIIKHIPDTINCISLMGGDPLHPSNIEVVKDLLENYSHNYYICIYTGYDILYVQTHNIKYFTFLKCGKFQVDKQQASHKDSNTFVLASTNQILYDHNFTELTDNGIYNFTKESTKICG